MFVEFITNQYMLPYEKKSKIIKLDSKLCIFVQKLRCKINKKMNINSVENACFITLSDFNQTDEDIRNILIRCRFVESLDINVFKIDNYKFMKDTAIFFVAF